MPRSRTGTSGAGPTRCELLVQLLFLAALDVAGVVLVQVALATIIQLSSIAATRADYALICRVPPLLSKESQWSLKQRQAQRGSRG